MDLHYSQTRGNLMLLRNLFESPMDLHYSQTLNVWDILHIQFESPMDLHYSQTCTSDKNTSIGLNPLWIYTTLKPL